MERFFSILESLPSCFLLHLGNLLLAEVTAPHNYSKRVLTEMYIKLQQAVP